MSPRSSLSVLPAKLDPRDELTALCKRTDAVVSECANVRDRLDHFRNRMGAFVSAEDLDASRDGQAAVISGLERELDAVNSEIRWAFVQRKTYEQVRSSSLRGTAERRRPRRRRTCASARMRAARADMPSTRRAAHRTDH
jgi:hypothetical protein